jgi:L-arabinokinase
LRVRASCPRWLWSRELEARTIDWNAEACDVGVVQSDDLQVDHVATAKALQRWRTSYDRRVRQEVERLGARGGGVDLIFSDVAPLAFDVATRLGVPSVAMANFSWDWIYRELGYEADADQAAGSYQFAGVLLELEPGCPMPAFRERKPLGVVGRRSKLDRAHVRERLGIATNDHLIMPAFRALDPSIIALPQPQSSVRYVIPGNPVARADIVAVEDSLTFVDLLAATDLVVAKPGYGIIADSAAAGIPILYVKRTGFPEDAFLERWLATETVAAPVDTEALASGEWIADAERLLRRERPQPRALEGLELGCDEILTRLA